jgi:hypothetical protein
MEHSLIRAVGGFARVGLVLVCCNFASAAVIHTSVHTFAFGGDPSAVVITLNLSDGLPMGRYLWEYTVDNNSYDPNPGTSNGFSGFELFLPTPIPEIADIEPNPTSTPPWEINCCSGNPVEWDIRNSSGLGVMPGESRIFSFTTAPRAVAVNDAGWFHTWQTDVQTDIVPTVGMHVPLVPGLTPIVPEPGTWTMLAGGGAALLLMRWRSRKKA